MTGVSIVSAFLAARKAVADANMLAIYKQDNDGYVWLKANFPHLVVQLDDLTMGWTLLPKSVVRDPLSLQIIVQTYRDNLQYGVPSYLPDGLTGAEFQAMMNKALDYITDSILPVLKRMEGANNASA